MKSSTFIIAGVVTAILVTSIWRIYYPHDHGQQAPKIALLTADEVSLHFNYPKHNGVPARESVSWVSSDTAPDIILRFRDCAHNPCPAPPGLPENVVGVMVHPKDDHRRWAHLLYIENTQQIGFDKQWFFVPDNLAQWIAKSQKESEKNAKDATSISGNYSDRNKP